MAAAEHEFDPRAILAVLERNYVNYVLIGGLARVIRGADEVTRGVDISPSFARENLDRLVTALAELDARRLGGKALTLSDESLAREVIELSTSAGELKIVACPAGAPSALRGPATRRHQEAPRSRAAAAGRLDRRPRKAGRRASPRPGHRQAAQSGG
jgi:hypothetical protein